MLKQTYNAVVRYTFATTAEETAEVFAGLPVTLAQGLAREVAVAGDAHRYDADDRCAYYFERQETSLAVWSWNEVHRPHEAGELIFLVVSSIAPLDGKLASEFYVRATGRSIETPRLAVLPNEQAGLRIALS